MGTDRGAEEMEEEGTVMEVVVVEALVGEEGEAVMDLLGIPFQ